MTDATSAGREEEALIPLSALQHQLFCPRQCALIHVEQTWAENALTVEGRLLHAAADQVHDAKRRGVRTVTALPIRSFALGVSGIADVVEFASDGRPFPVEYKRGRPKAHRADEVQLCAQAICLEEMLDRPVHAGALFYGQTRRRTDIAFDDELRALTASVAREAAALIASDKTPPPVYAKSKCARCSLSEICRPRAFSDRQSATDWIASQIETALCADT